MNDPYSRISQPLTDALLQLDRSISMAESNVAAAQQIGLPEASDLALRLPALTLRARQFLASVPDMGQPQTWGGERRPLDQAQAVIDHRQIAQPEEIHLQQADLLDVVFGELDRDP